MHTILDEKMQDLAVEYARLFIEDVKPLDETNNRLFIYFRKSKLIFFKNDILDKENNVVINKDLPVMIEKMIHRD